MTDVVCVLVGNERQDSGLKGLLNLLCKGMCKENTSGIAEAIIDLSLEVKLWRRFRLASLSPSIVFR